MPAKRKDKKGGGGASQADASQPRAQPSGPSPEDQLWTAIKRGDKELLTEVLFIEMENPEADNHFGVEAFILSPKPTAKALLNHKQNAKQLTPLTFAIDQAAEPELVLLLLRAGADINGKDGSRDRATALHRAALLEDAEMVTLLLKNGADVRTTNARKETVLHLLAASETGSDLIERIVDLVSLVKNSRNGEGTGAREDRGDEGERDPYQLPGRRVVTVDPIAVLALQDEKGATVLDSAAGEVVYGSTGSIMALLSIIEDAAQSSASAPEAIAALLSAARSSDQATLLHSLLDCADESQGDAAAALAVLRRLVSVEASVAAGHAGGILDWTARDAKGLTPVMRASTSFPRTGEEAVQLMTFVLTRMQEMHTARGAPLDWVAFLADHDNTDHETLLHSLIRMDNGAGTQALANYLQANVLADASEELQSGVVRSLRSLCYKGKESSGESPELLRDLLRDSAATLAKSAVTASTSAGDGNHVRSVSSDILSALVALHVITEAHVENVHMVAKAVAREQEKIKAGIRGPAPGEFDEEDGGVDETSSDEEAGPAAMLRKRAQGTGGSAVVAPTGANAGLSRAQQSLRARGAVVADAAGAGGGHVRRRKGTRGQGLQASAEDGAGSATGMSQPAKVFLALAFVAVAFLVYTSFTNPVLSGDQDDQGFA